MNEADLREFVDRDKEMARFKAMLEERQKPILFIWGDGGLGKSSLLAKMIHECSARGIRKSEVYWSETRNYDYVGIMRKIRDDLGAGHFNEFTRLVNRFTGAESEEIQVHVSVESSGQNKVAEGATIEGSRIGTIANVVIDKMYVLPRNDMAIPESERMIRLTDLFLREFSAVVAREPVVVFFDTVEKMTEETHRWVWNELLEAVRASRLEKARFVQCGRQKPPISRDMQRLTDDAQLGPLGEQDIEEYLIRRGVGDKSRVNAASWLFAATEGKPGAVAVMVDAFLSRHTTKS